MLQHRYLAILYLAIANQASAQVDFYLAAYHNRTGEIVFPRLSGEIELKLTAVENGALIGGQATDLSGAASGALAAVDDQADSMGFIRWTNLGGLNTNWPVSAGNVARTNLLAQGMVPECPGWCGYLVGGIEFEITDAQMQTVKGYVVQFPEPSTTALFLIAALTSVGYRVERRLRQSR